MFKNSENFKDAYSIVESLQNAGAKAFFVGGCVRDNLLKRCIHDFDIATSLTPDEITEIFPNNNFVGNSHGVSLVRINKVDYEVSTFRKDGAYSDGRRPDEVFFTRNLKEDASRRDLTINAIYYDPIKKRYKDPFNGKDDIKHGWITFIGDPKDRIQEDHLRIMRAIRFKLQLEGFNFSPSAFYAVTENIELLDKLPMERIRDEFFKIVKTVEPGVWVMEFFITGLADVILPELRMMENTNQDPVWHPEGNVLKHSCLVADHLFKTYGDLETTLAGVFHDLGKITTTEKRMTSLGERLSAKGHAKESARIFRTVAARMLFPNKLRDTLAEVAYDHMSLFKYKDMKKSTIKKYMNKAHAEILLNLLEADTIGNDYPHETNPGTELKAMKEDFEENNTVNPHPILTGLDLLTLGWKPGPHFSTVLNKVRDMQLDGEIYSHEEALEFARANAEEA